jgi:hypothetical protein
MHFTLCLCSVQRIGFKEGLPFTDYWRGHQAQKALLRVLSERIKSVLKVWPANMFLTFSFFCPCVFFGEGCHGECIEARKLLGRTHLYLIAYIRCGQHECGCFFELLM